MEIVIERKREEFEFPDYIETHGASPNKIVPQCRSYLKENENIMRINEEKLKQLASDIVSGNIYTNETITSLGKSHVNELLESSAKNHPSQHNDNKTRIGDIARIIAYNVVNFSFYPERGETPWWIEIEKDGEMIPIGKDDEFFAITASFERAEQRLKQGTNNLMDINVNEDPGRQWCNYEYLSNLNLTKLEEIFEPAPGAGKLPLLELRLKCLHSLSELYEKMTLEEFICLCEEKSVQKKGESTPRTLEVGIFVSLLSKYVPAFRDYRFDIPFAKRPQLTIAMLHKSNLIYFSDMENLTVFSDYRLPQLFISKGIFEFSINNNDKERILEDVIMKQKAIKSHSELEICLRSGSIVAAEDLRHKLADLSQKEIKIANLDYYLWRTCVLLDTIKELVPHHRTRTFCY